MLEAEVIDELEAIQKGEFTGVVSDLPAEMYHKAPGLSSTSFRRFMEVPLLYKKGFDDKETAPQRLGTLVHMKAQEPERFAKEVVIVAGNGNSTAVKEAIAEAEMQGKYVCRSQKEFDQINGMVDALYSKKWAKKLITSGENEKSYFAHHPLHGFIMKARTDSVHEDIRVIADLKTFGALDDRSLDRQIRSMKYDIQAVHYLITVSEALGKRYDKYVIVFVSTIYPYCVRTVALAPPTIERAWNMAAEKYEKFEECLRTDTWPDYEDDIVDFNLWF